jgi:hypothetical protein
MPAPGGSTVACLTDAVAPTAPTVNDNCARALIVTGPVASADPACNGIKTYTYTYEDCTGATYDWVYTYTITPILPVMNIQGTPPSICGASDGFITISNLDPNTDYNFSYNGGATGLISTNGVGEYVITGLGSGSYTGFYN